MTESTKFLETGGWGFLFAACVISLLSTFGALFTGEVMGQTPCLLCWYQRAFMFPLTVILAVACFRSDLDVWRYALPVAMIGWAIAAYHALFYVGAIPQAIERLLAMPVTRAFFPARFNIKIVKVHDQDRAYSNLSLLCREF